MSYKYKVPSEEIQVLLKSLYDSCSAEDITTRERQIRQWRRLKLLWEGFNRIWFNEVAHDWRVWDESINNDDSDQAYYDKPINIFESLLETLVAALSVTVPPVKCYPDDADNTLDLDTARAGDKIGTQIYRHNDVPQLWLHALYQHMTEGMIAFRHYALADKKYGTYEEKSYEDNEENHEIVSCAMCGHVISDNVVPPSANTSNPETGQPIPGQQVLAGQPGMTQPGQMPGQPVQPVQNPNKLADLETKVDDEFGPNDGDVELHAAMNSGQELCPACMVMMDPQIQQEKFIVSRLTGVTSEPKSRIIIKSYGGLWVKIPQYAKAQEECGYLKFSDEKDYTLVVERYSHLKDNDNLIKDIKSGSNGPGGYTQYEQWGRLSPQYMGEYPSNVVTVNEIWIRPGRFNELAEQKQVDLLKKHYPDGVKAVFINDQFAEACNRSLDDEWTILENPLADYLYFDPPGQKLVNVQEITNDLISLVLQTIEHGIGQTFADPAVLNFNAYNQVSALPGGVYAATPKSGKTLGESFYELRTATLSGEVLPFANKIQELGQFVSGALPSIFGGTIEGGSNTASEYSMSRAQALQRLQNTWKTFCITWKRVFAKAIPAYIETVTTDEHEVQRTDAGDFINVFIRKAELEGKIGRVELECNENLPMTFTQRRDLMMQLFTATSPAAQSIINAPENLPLIHDTLGLPDMYIPNEGDVIKQLNEIKILLNSEPIPTGNPDQPEMPSVEVDPLYDTHPVQFEIVKKWATSEAGQQAKLDNEAGYRNVLLHGRMHFMQVQQQQMMAAQSQAPQGPGTPNAKPDTTKTKEAPITGESDVHPTA